VPGRPGDFLRASFVGWGSEEESGGAESVGFTGLAVPKPFTPCVEIGWRLSAEHWGRSYATEAAWAALLYGFETFGLDEIVSFTVPMNVRSRRVMEKLGMTHDPSEDFDHPALPEGHRLRRHVLYRVGCGKSLGDRYAYRVR
jgi:ribosomal-protein-alanine N-acetyltransferase